jgi:AcrR family transcriptional regulator
MGELIVTKARELFFSYGLRSVSMDDVARQAGISKKTIYQSFSDKSELIQTIVDDLIQCHHRLSDKCKAAAADAIDEVLLQSSAPFDTWAAVTPGFFYELEKFFPPLWQKLEAHKSAVLLPGIINNLERGKNEGLYRDDINKAFTADIRIHHLTTALQPHLLTSQRMSVSQLMAELTLFYLHSITTEKGKNRLTKYLKNRNENRTKN